MLRLLLIISASLLVLGSNEFGVKFLEDNAKQDGVISLPSGLQYKVLRAGSGDSHPTADSSCECHYEGRVAQSWPSGETFDSSYARGSPTSFAPNQVIKGWTEAMQLMVEGDKWEMYIPSDLGYGDGGQGGKIKGGDVLIFRMEIVTIKGNKKPADRCDIATMKGCNDKQVKYLGKQSAGTSEKRTAELKRLEGMAGGEMKDEARAWLMSRIKLLKKMVAKDEL